MKPIASAQIIGEKDVQAALDKLGAAMAGQNLEAAVVAGALEIMNAAKRKAPYITGTLRRSIHIGGYTDKSPDFDPSGDLAKHGGRYNDIKGNKAERDKVEVHVGTDLEYAPPVEFGTGRRVAKPYLRPAFDEELEAAKKQAAVALKVLLSKVAK